MVGMISYARSSNLINKDVVVRLSTIDGTTKMVVEDRDGAPVWLVDSKGNQRQRGTSGKI
mgnify:CR=1 FL=1